MRRIGYGATVLVAPYSGVQVAVEAVALALARALGPDLTLFLPRDYAGAEFPDATIFRAPVSGRSRLARIAWEQFCLPGVARRQGIDLLHSPAYVMPLGWRGPAVVTVYDLLTLTHPEWCRRGNVAHFRLLLPRSLRGADRIVVPSHATADEILARVPIVPDKLRLLPLGIESRFQPASPEAVDSMRRRYGLPERYLLVVGNLEPKKNLPGTARIFARLAGEIPHQLVLAGRRGWGDPRPWQRAVQELPPGRVNLLGYVPREDLPALYSGADLLLHLSWHEGFGLPPLEAMACGTPVVVSNRGALPEVAGPAAWVVDPADETTAVRAIGELLANETRRRDLAERGRRHAAGFTWARHARGLVEVYREVLNERPR